MYFRSSRIIAIALVASSGCSAPESSPAHSSSIPAASSTAAATSADSAPAFVDRVWVVAESKGVSQGELRVFLSEGTLVMASPNATPAFGEWRYRDGQLTIIEESLEYRVEILELHESAFRIRIFSPGAPLEILFVPAGGRLN
jgi:hypothetical protein